MTDELGANVQEPAEPVEFDVEAELAKADAEEAEPQQEEQTESEPVEPQGENDAEPAEPQRDYEKDHAYAELRRRAEEAERQAALIKSERDELAGALRGFEFEGDSTDDLVNAALARQTDRPIEEIKAERDKERRYKELEVKAKLYEQERFERFKADDLEAIKAKYADEDAKSVDDFGETFFKLRANGVSPLAAYAAIRAEREIKTTPKPPSPGSVKTSSTKEPREYFTNEELDALTSADLNKPGILDKAMKSLERLGRKK